MSEKFLEVLRESLRRNCIPSGRQLPRTPPLTDVKRHLDFSVDDLNVSCEEARQEAEAAARDKDDWDRNQTLTTSPHEMGELYSKLKGMKGYQLTAGDLEFIKRMEEEKVVKKLQKELEDVQTLLKKESGAWERACVLKENAQAERSKFPSRDHLREWINTVLPIAHPSTDFSHLDTEALLAEITTCDVQETVDRKKVQLAQMKKTVASNNAQKVILDFCDRRKKEAEQRGRWEEEIASEQIKIQSLMNQLTELKSELEQQEEIYKTLQMQIKTQEELQIAAEEEGATTEEQQAKRQVKSGGKKRKQPVKPSETVEVAAKQSKKEKPTRSKRPGGKTGDQSVAKDAVNEKTAKPKPEAPSVKAVKSSRLPQKKVDEQGSRSRSAQSVKGGREGRRPPGATQAAAPQPRAPSKAGVGGARTTSRQAAPAPVAAGDGEAENAGLRRSRRIASKR